MSILRWLMFNLWYFRNPPWDTGISPPELTNYIDQHPPGRALDLGCGTGINVLTLAKHGWQATGVDYAISAIRSARRRISQAGVQACLRVADVRQLHNLQGPFDLILDMGCFHSLTADGRRAYLANIQRWLTPDGTFLLYTFFKDNPNQEGAGLVEHDLDEIYHLFYLANRQNGTERGTRPSAWLTIVNKTSIH